MLFTASLLENSLRLLGLIILFFLIIVACYYVTRFVGTKRMGYQKESSIRLIDIYRFGSNQTLLIVNVGKRYFLLASHKESIELITELNEEDVASSLSNRTGTIKFSEIFRSALKKQNEETMPTNSSNQSGKDEK